MFTGGSAGFAFESSASIAAGPLDAGGSGKRSDLREALRRISTATGDLIYVQNGTLMAVPFNSRRLELAGSPVPVLEGVGGIDAGSGSV